MARIEWQHAVAGGAAGAGAVLILQPLDVVKTRIQVQDGHYRGIPHYNNSLHCIKSIILDEGFKGLYAGLAPTLIGSGISWALYFFFYNNAKSRWMSMVEQDELSAPLHLISGVEAGSLATILTNPIWVLKTRLQLQRASPQPPRELYDKASKPLYKGMIDAVKTIAKEEGLSGLYRGLGTSLLLVSHGATQFMVYEELRSIIKRFSLVNNDGVSSIDALALGAISKFAATLITYPLQVTRSRLHQRFNTGHGLRYTSTWQALSSTFAREGLQGLYKGLVPNLFRVMPQSALTFMIYENTIQILKWL